MRDVLICGDILRANLELTHRPYNTRWFSALIRQAIEPLGIGSQVLGYSPPHFDFTEFYRTIYRQSGQSVLDKWAHFYDALNFEPEMAGRLFDIFSGKTVFLFEGSRSILNYISSIGGVYLNFRVSPLRFASDLIFIIETNDENVRSALRQFELETAFIDAQRNALKSMTAATTTTFPKPTLVFLGQVPGDASLIHEGRFSTIAVPDGLDTTRFSPDAIYHKPHPIDTNAAEIARWKGLFPSSQLLDMPTYSAFCSEGDLTFISISSGSGYEAQVLGHECHFVSPHNWALNGARWTRFSSVLYEYWFEDFWKAIFDALDGKSVENAAIQASKQQMGFTPERLRKTIDAKWAERSFLVSAS